MDKQQFATISIGIKSAYPASKILEDTASMDFWYKMLKDIPYDVAENAVMEHICTNIFPPNIAEIRKLCMERCRSSVLSFDEAWCVVQEAISTYGRDHPQEAFKAMDELTRIVVKNIGWTRLCLGNNLAADRANFREAYEARVSALQNSRQLPEFIAKKKMLLQEKYIPATEEKIAPRIEDVKRPPDPRVDLTPAQMEERVRKFEEIRRRILGD